MLSHHEHLRFTSRGLSRRGFLHTVGASALAVGSLSLRDMMSLQAADLKKQGKSMILLWMNGAPSQFETFDPKPGHENGGETKAIDTAVPGIQIAHHWDNVAKVMNDIALIRSMTNKEGQHPRATYQLHTGYIPSSSVKYPSLGSNLAKMLGDPQHELPSVVAIGQAEGMGSGFLGVDFEPFVVDQPGQLPQNVAASANVDRFQRRLGLLSQVEKEFADRGGQVVATNHQQLYSKASKLVLSPQVKRFQFDDEPVAVQERYGNSEFGKGCLLARRMVESGVTFVEVTTRGAGAGGNWDTHQDNFARTATLSQQVDPGMAALIGDLKERGMLDRTLVVWMGEFGRTPKINPRGGRDHYPRVFNAAIAGCGTKGGQVIGASTKDGSAIDHDPVTVHDLFCTICKALEVDPAHANISPLGRPIKIVDGGKPVTKLFA